MGPITKWLPWRRWGQSQNAGVLQAIYPSTIEVVVSEWVLSKDTKVWQAKVFLLDFIACSGLSLNAHLSIKIKEINQTGNYYHQLIDQEI